MLSAIISNEMWSFFYIREIAKAFGLAMAVE